ELFRERLRALEPRGGGGRAEDAETRGREPVDEPERQRQLRADDGEVDLLLRCEALETLQIVDPDRHALRLLGDPRVPGRAPERIDSGTLPQLPHEGVLAPAAADDEDAHQCRKCRTPVNTIATSCRSAAATTSSSRVLPPG